MELADYIAQSNLDAALRFLNAIDDTFHFLAGNGASIPLCNFAEDDFQAIRVWPVHGFRNYLVFFIAADDGVVIERVLHGARDVESIFRKDD
jgi:toxin ParE1/3/4